MTGLLILVSAPSGAGKTTLVKALLNDDARLAVSVSHTTRARRGSEVAGVNYHFVSEDTFSQMVADGEFLEHAEVFGQRYGTSHASINSLLQQGRDVILEIDWQGAAQIRKLVECEISIFILPPSLETLKQRLLARGEDDPAVIEHRLAQAMDDMAQHTEYDYLIINDKFDTALADMLAILRAERLRAKSVMQEQAQLLERLCPDSS